VESTPDAIAGAALTTPATITTTTAISARYSTNVCPRSLAGGSAPPVTARSCARGSHPSGGADEPRSHVIPSAIQRSRQAA
jgi:hypothetical protein